jgi:hypothetical protein
MNLPAWLRRRRDRRAVDRLINPGIVAYFWDGGPPHPNPVRDISHEGAYVETISRWYVGTILALTLKAEGNEMKPALAQIAGEPVARAPEVMQVSCRVARQEPDGIGVQFPHAGAEGRRKLMGFIASCVEKRAKKNSQTGHSLLEFVLITRC